MPIYTAPLSIKNAIVGNSIAQEVDGNITGSKSLATLSATAGKTPPHSMLEFVDNHIVFKDDGGIDLSSIGSNVINIGIRMTASASQSWINCNFPPPCYVEGSYCKDTVAIVSVSAEESSASESDKDTNTTNIQTGTISNCTKDSVLTVDYTATRQYDSCGDAYGTLTIEIISVTTVSGPNTFAAGASINLPN